MRDLSRSMNGSWRLALGGRFMHRILVLIAIVTVCGFAASAQTTDEIVAHYVKAVGGMDKIQAVHSLRRSGKFIGGGGFEAVIMQENKRDASVREEFSLQGMTAINAFDGKTGWKVEPWAGKKDPEALGEEEMKSIVEDADFDGPLIDYKRKGNKVEFVGMDKFEGTDTYKLVNGWYLPFAVEVNTKGHQDKSKYVYDKIEANVTLDDSRFVMPVMKK